eukprot:TRINITY_DN11476_c0_g1_i4.p1 TRINITY_DN11476_c0_g1~~TRINITY_DN11476_c0_g1_i4.p1  ORF type:complete len:292 (-),score=45.75 TRINITY_DN11476_c0_g1_i4:145-1020(-)
MKETDAVNELYSTEYVKKEPEKPSDEQYKSIDGKPSRLALAGFSITADTCFDPVQWRNWFERHTSAEKRNRKCISGMRLVVQNQTIKAFTKGHYLCADGSTKINLNLESIRSLSNTTLYSLSDFDTEKGSSDLPPKSCKLESVTVVNADCLKTALDYVDKGFKTMVLNMANQSTPGGGYKSGSGAQEENLHRRTNLFYHLEQQSKDKYPLPDFGGLFSKDVLVIRDGENKGYAFLEKPKLVNVFTIAADRRPKLVGKGVLELNPDFAERMLKKNTRHVSRCKKRENGRACT